MKVHQSLPIRARILLCAVRLYAGHDITATWISKRFGIGIAAARRDVRWLGMYLPVQIVDGVNRRGKITTLKGVKQ